MTRQEHMQWCKDRALEYVAQGDFDQALASMVSDLGKHADTKGSVQIGAMLGFAEVAAAKKLPGPHGKSRMKKFIEGFN